VAERGDAVLVIASNLILDDQHDRAVQALACYYGLGRHHEPLSRQWSRWPTG
jgi:hypothetical protein